MSGLAAAVDGVALIGPGLAGWAEAGGALSGAAPYLRASTAVPAPSLLPPNERRRAGLAVRIALATGAAALEAARADPAQLATVFASSSADGDTCHAICEQLAGSDRMISPTRFHNSVHNAPSGYWSIAARCRAPSTSLCAYDASFGAGLLEACALAHAGDRAVLLIAYDAPYPEPLHAKRPVPDAFGVALLLAPVASAASLAHLSLDISGREADRLAEPSLEALRREIPTARALPLLARLARGEPGEVVLEYLEGLNLRARVSPCR